MRRFEPEAFVDILLRLRFPSAVTVRAVDSVNAPVPGTHRLSDAALGNLRADPGRRRSVADGEGLFVIVTDASKRWQYHYQHEGRRRSLSLGTYPTVSLAKARDEHACAQRWLKVEGRDPVEAREADGERRRREDADGAMNSNAALRRLDKDRHVIESVT